MMVRYGLVVDLKRCVGCYSCQVACKVENGTQPEVFWARVMQKEMGNYPYSRRVFLPVTCFHCKDAPCFDVCPSKATTKRSDGIVTVDNTKCIGCRYCMMACPYGARFFVDQIKTYFPGHITPFESAKSGQHTAGVVEKCTFCEHRIDAGVKKRLKPGVDREATPACVPGCISKARFFGDLEDPASEVSQLIAKRRGFQLHPELGTDPSVYYLW